MQFRKRALPRSRRAFPINQSSSGRKAATQQNPTLSHTFHDCYPPCDGKAGAGGGSSCTASRFCAEWCTTVYVDVSCYQISYCAFGAGGAQAVKLGKRGARDLRALVLGLWSLVLGCFRNFVCSALFRGNSISSSIAPLSSSTAILAVVRVGAGGPPLTCVPPPRKTAAGTDRGRGRKSSAYHSLHLITQWALIDPPQEGVGTLLAPDTPAACHFCLSKHQYTIASKCRANCAETEWISAAAKRLSTAPITRISAE
jgi:hypothetical protein